MPPLCFFTSLLEKYQVYSNESTPKTFGLNFRYQMFGVDFFVFEGKFEIKTTWDV